MNYFLVLVVYYYIVNEEYKVKKQYDPELDVDVHIRVVALAVQHLFFFNLYILI